MTTPNKGKEIHDLLNAAIGKISPEQLIAEIEDISRTMPPIEQLHQMTPQNLVVDRTLFSVRGGLGAVEDTDAERSRDGFTQSYA